MKVFQRNQLLSANAGVVVGHNQKQGVLPIVAFFRLLKECPKCPIGIAYGIFNGGRVSLHVDPAGGVFPGRVIADSKCQSQAGRIRRFTQQAMHFIEHVFIGSTPGTNECRVAEAFALVQRIKPIAQEETLHVVEMGFTAVDEARVIAILFEQLCQRKEAALRTGKAQGCIG